MYTTKIPSSDSESDTSEIRSDRNAEQNKRTICMQKKDDENIYSLKVELANKNRRIDTEAQFKIFFTQTWTDLIGRSSTYEVLNNDKDWETR